jgi:hypothetical protein
MCSVLNLFSVHDKECLSFKVTTLTCVDLLENFRSYLTMLFQLQWLCSVEWEEDSGWWIASDVEFMIYFKALPRHFADGLRKTTKSLVRNVGLREDNRTRDLGNVNDECQPLGHNFGEGLVYLFSVFKSVLGCRVGLIIKTSVGNWMEMPKAVEVLG